MLIVFCPTQNSQEDQPYFQDNVVHLVIGMVGLSGFHEQKAHPDLQTLFDKIYTNGKIGYSYF